MALVCWGRESFALENMAKVSSTGSACNFYSSPVWIRLKTVRSGETLEESWPATPRVELCCGPVKGSSTSCTLVHSRFKKLVVFPGSWLLSPLHPQNPELFRRENSPPLLFGLLNRAGGSHGYEP
nr:putative protein [Ipomoea batatas]